MESNHTTEPAETSLSGKTVNSPGALATKLQTKRTVAATAKSEAKGRALEAQALIGQMLAAFIEREALADARETRVLRRRLRRLEAEEASNRHAVGALPRDRPLRVEPFEIADEEHSEVHAWRDAWTPGGGSPGVRARLPRPCAQPSPGRPPTTPSE